MEQNYEGMKYNEKFKLAQRMGLPKQTKKYSGAELDSFLATKIKEVSKVAKDAKVDEMPLKLDKMTWQDSLYFALVDNGVIDFGFTGTVELGCGSGRTARGTRHFVISKKAKKGKM